ncbi:MAG: hypothetical protein QOJ50_1400, partial [Cryptosporangiaceae bacterium]|nr:hypothetical protein [Cryptosporangiaceae bacterium]
MPLFEVGPDGLAAFRAPANAAASYDQTLEEALWRSLDSIAGEQLLRIRRQAPLRGGGSPAVVALDRNGSVVVVHVRYQINRVDLAECLEYAAWARATTIDEIASLYWRGGAEFWSDWATFAPEAPHPQLSRAPRLVIVTSDFTGNAGSTFGFLVDSGLPVKVVMACLYENDNGRLLLEVRGRDEALPSAPLALTAGPASAPPLSIEAPASGVPASVAPISPAAYSAPPVPSFPVSGVPVTGAPVSGSPVSIELPLGRGAGDPPVVTPGVGWPAAGGGDPVSAGGQVVSGLGFGADDPAEPVVPGARPAGSQPSPASEPSRAPTLGDRRRRGRYAPIGDPPQLSQDDERGFLADQPSPASGPDIVPRHRGAHGRDETPPSGESPNGQASRDEPRTGGRRRAGRGFPFEIPASTAGSYAEREFGSLPMPPRPVSSAPTSPETTSPAPTSPAPASPAPTSPARASHSAPIAEPAILAEPEAPSSMDAPLREPAPWDPSVSAFGGSVPAAPSGQWQSGGSVGSPVIPEGEWHSARDAVGPRHGDLDAGSA